MRAAIIGIAGVALSPDEKSLLRAHPPAGVILFGRNIAGLEPLADLVGALREILPADAVLMIDQEGGRVARLRPPDWPSLPPAAVIGALFAASPPAATRAAWLQGALIGGACAQAGFDVVTAPVLDLRHPDGHDVIGDRAFGAAPQMVATLARAMAAGLLDAGVQPVGKHVPGHGRVGVDSHLALPEQDILPTEADDLLPFVQLADLPWMMTAHIRFRGWDARLPASLSGSIIRRIIRGRIGFDGVLVSDDLAMGAVSSLANGPAALAALVLAAGSDLALFCAGDFAQNRALLAGCAELTEAALARLLRARAMAASARRKQDLPALAAEQAAILAAPFVA